MKYQQKIKNSEKENRFYERLENDFGKEFTEWAKQHRNKVPDKWLNSGCKTQSEYQDKCSQKLGYKNFTEREKMRRWNRGLHEPMSENRDCSSFLGVCIGEYTLKEFLLTIFEQVEKMDYGNSGFDFICKEPKQEFIDKYHCLKLTKDKEYKIELKSRCLQYVGTRIGWNFTGIDRGNGSDIFILIGLDNIESLTPQHMWIFDRNDIVRGKEFWNRYCFYVTNGPKYLKELRKYELVDEIGMLRKFCNNRINEIN